MAGLITGLIGVIRAISYAALIFSGDLSPYLNVGVGLAVFSTAAISIVVALTSSIPGMIATPLAAPTAVLAMMAAAIASQLVNITPPNEILFTVITAIALGSLGTGLFLWILGRLGLGQLIQFIPYPVVGGFMAGTGWLLVRGAFQVMTDEELTMTTISWFFQSDHWLHWGVGAFIAIGLLIVSKRFQHFLVMPSLLVMATALFYLVLLATQTPVHIARDQGWLLGPFPNGGLWHPLQLAELHQVHWQAIASQSSTIGLLMFVSLLSLVLTNNGIELVIGKDINLNRELQAVGMANIAAGLGSSMVGNQALPSTLLVHRMGANNRLSGVFKTIPCTTVLLLGSSFLSYFPKPVLGSLLLFLGLDLLIHWVYESWFKLSWIDYGTVLITMGAINWIGFLEGICIGFAITSAIFLYRYSQVGTTPIVYTQAIATSFREGSEGPEQNSTDKDQILVLELQGFLFFGSATNLWQIIRQKITGYEVLEQVLLAATQVSSPTYTESINNQESIKVIRRSTPRYLLLDFRQVSGLDASAVLTFSRILESAEQKGLTVVYTHLTPEFEKQLIRGRGLLENSPQCLQFADLKQGLCWCETNDALLPN